MSYVSVLSLTLYHKLNDADSLVRALVECMIDRKENIDANLIASFRSGNLVYNSQYHGLPEVL